MKKYIAFLRGIGSGKPLFKGLKDKLKLTLLNVRTLGGRPAQLHNCRCRMRGSGMKDSDYCGGFSENKI